MNEFIESIKGEIESKPELYQGKTAKEIVEIINNPIVTEKAIGLRQVVEIPEPTTEIITEDAPVLRIINGIPEAPNIVTEEDILTALKQ